MCGGEPGQAQAVDAIYRQRVLGIIRADSAEAARDLTLRLWRAGLRAVEISVSTPGAIEAVKAARAEHWLARTDFGYSVTRLQDVTAILRDVNERRTAEEEDEATQESSDVQERREKLTDDVDAMLDEIDEVLEENAEEFVRSYVQKGGE